MRFRRRPRPAPLPGPAYDLPPEAVGPPGEVVVEEPYPPAGAVVEERYAPGPPVEPPPEREFWPWLLLLLLLVLGGLAALYFLTRDDNRKPARTVTVQKGPLVPSVVGLPQRTARAQLGTRGFRAVVRSAPSPRPRGIVTGQRPKAGERARRGAVVVLVVSGGPARIAVPNLIGLRAPEAVQRARNAGLVPLTRSVFSSKPSGVAVNEVPAAGTQVPKGSKLTVGISKGQQRVVVPNVVDSDEATAGAALRRAGFVPVVFNVPAADPKGTVVAQSPRAGLRAAKGSRVRINVSEGATPGGTGGTSTQTFTATTTQTQPAASRVPVPNVVGKPQGAASRQLRQAGLFVSVVYVTSSQPQSVVVAERPAAGTSVRTGSTVRINVSTGPSPNPLRAIPDVVGEDEQTAAGDLRQAGFKVETIDEPTSDPSQDGFVVDEEPTGGSKAPQGSLVTISVGRSATTP